MTTKAKATAEDTGAVSINRSATIGLEDCKLTDFQDAATKVGAPDTARISTGGAFPIPDSTDFLPYSVTFSWTEEV